MEDTFIEQTVDAFADFINNGKAMPSELAKVIFDWLKLPSTPLHPAQTRKEDLLERFDAVFREKLLTLDLDDVFKRLPKTAPKQPPSLLRLVGGLWYLHALIHENKSTYEADAIPHNLNCASELLVQLIESKATLPKAYQVLHVSGKSLRRYLFKYALPWLREGQMPERNGRFKANLSKRSKDILVMSNRRLDSTIDKTPAVGEAFIRADIPTQNPSVVSVHCLHEWCIAESSQAKTSLEIAIRTGALQASLTSKRGAVVGAAVSGKTTLLRQYQQEHLQKSEAIAVYTSVQQYSDYIRNPSTLAAVALFDAANARGLVPENVTIEDIEAALKTIPFTLLVDGDKLSGEASATLLRSLTRLPKNANWLVTLSLSQELLPDIAGWQVVRITRPTVVETVMQIRHDSEYQQRRQSAEHLLFRTAPILRQSHLSISVACQETLTASAGLRWRAVRRWINMLLTRAPHKSDADSLSCLLSALAFNTTSSSDGADTSFKIEAVKGIPGRKIEIHPERGAINVATNLGLLSPCSSDDQTHFVHTDLRRLFAAQAWVQQVLSARETTHHHKRKILAWHTAPQSAEINQLLSERWQLVLTDAVAMSISFLDDPSPQLREIYSSQYVKFLRVLHEFLGPTKLSVDLSNIWPKLPLLEFAISRGLAAEQSEFSLLRIVADQYPALLMRLAASWRLVLDKSLCAQQLSPQDCYYSLRLLTEMKMLNLRTSNTKVGSDVELLAAVARRVIYDSTFISTAEHEMQLQNNFPGNLPEVSMRAYFLSYGCESLNQLLSLACQPNYVYRLAAVRCLVYGALLSPKPTIAANHWLLLDEAFAYGTPEIQAEIVAFLLGNPFNMQWKTALCLAASPASALEQNHHLLTDACRQYGAAMATVRAKQTLQKQRDGLPRRLKAALEAIAAASKPQSLKTFL